MAQIINISNSVDYKPSLRSTAISEDEEEHDDQHHLLSPTLDIDQSIHEDVDIHPPTSVHLQLTNDNDSITTDDLSQSTTMPLPPTHSYQNLSSSSSESSLARPLLQEKHRIVPIYSNDINSEDLTEKSIINSSDSTVYHRRSSLKYYAIDMFISAFIITPFVNIHWRGAWDLLDIYVLPNHERISALLSVLLGLLLLYLIYLSQNFIQSIYEKYRKQIFGQILARVFTLVFAFAYINQWRGLWNLIDFTSNLWYYLLIETTISITCLLIMKSVYDLNSAPFLIGTDTEHYFLIGSKFQVSNNRFAQYTFDFVFYEVFEAPLVVVAWRGLYNLSDLYIYPENKTISMLISFFVGYSLYFLLGIIQIPFVQCFLKRRYESIHAILSNLLHLIAFISVVQIWRSLWMMCEQYINIPGYHHLTLWLCYGIAYVVLICGLAACSLNGPGGAKDSYIDGQPILLFKFDYISALVKNQSNSKTDKTDCLVSDSSSTETIVTADRTYRFQPP